MLAEECRGLPQTEKEDCPERPLYGELKLPFKHAYLHGWIYPPFIKQKHLDATKSFNIRPDDIFIATFPKNGTTWTQKIIQNLHKMHNTGLLQEKDKCLADVIPWLENTEIDKIDAMEGQRYIKTHNSYDFVAYDADVPCKYIYVSRDPKDVCVSLYHHCKGFEAFQYDGPFEEFAELFLVGRVESGDWWVHVREYYENAKNMNTLFLKYEDMHAEGDKAVRQLNDFCGLPEITEEQCSEILGLSTFKKMKKDPNCNYSWLDDVRKDNEAPFMRKGKVGDWRNFFSEEMSEKFDEKTARMFVDVKFEFYDKI